MHDVGALGATERRNRDFDAGNHLLADRYVQHDPIVASVHEGLRGFIKTFSAERPGMRTDLKHVDDGTVMLHAHGSRFASGVGVAIVEMYRLKAAKIVEQWEVIRPNPQEIARDDGLFEILREG